MSHTPGPWRIGNLESYDGYTGKPFRNVWAGEDDCIARAIDVGDVDANARLIAAAPDLLRAAEDLLDRKRARGAEGIASEYWHDLEDAVKKARG